MDSQTPAQVDDCDWWRPTLIGEPAPTNVFKRKQSQIQLFDTVLTENTVRKKILSILMMMMIMMIKMMM